MDSRYAISLVLAAHVPFVREHRKDEDLTQAGEEGRFFDMFRKPCCRFWAF